MAPKPKTTAADRKKKSREKKKNELGEEEYLRERAEKQKEWRQNRELTPAQKEEQTTIERERKRKQRVEKKLAEATTLAEKKKIISKSAIYRSVAKADNALPKSPRSKGIVLMRLAHLLTPNQKSVYHMSMRELRDTLEAMQLRNAELEEKEFMTTQLGLKVDQLQAQLAMTENELQKSRKKCKRLHLELSESRYKEEQDTEDLDRMVKKVEKKLERSEARAAEAESELSRTRSQITSCETDRVSWELSQSADNAEKLVKQMCNGIEGLRKIAASLASKNSR